MDINELESYRLSDAIKFNDHLNPKLWGSDEHLLPEVQEKLLAIADDFREFLGIGDLEIKDITVSGSNAAYTYTPHSDIDLHLVVDLPKADASEVYKELFDAKKYQYNDQHNFKIGNYDVELYVQNANEPHHSQGIYSVLNNDWVSVPRRRKPSVNDISVRSKYQDLGKRIEQAIASGNRAQLDAMGKKVRDLRQSGLDQNGEFGPENLAFKVLRNNGTLEKLRNARYAAKDKELSIDEQQKQKVTYGFKRPQVVEATVEPIEAPVPASKDIEEILKPFINSCVKYLGIKKVPRFIIKRDPEWTRRNGTFGRFEPDTESITLATSGRHTLDILRTLAHELTHARQNEIATMPQDAGETGSPHEDQANAMAGRIMRHWVDQYPEFFKDVQLEESLKNKLAGAAAAACIAGSPGCATTQGMSTADTLRDIQTVGRTAQTMKQMGSAGAKEELIQQLKNQLRRQRGQVVPESVTDKDHNPMYNVNEATGFIPVDSKLAHDPRYVMGLTVDIKPGETQRQAKKLGWAIDKDGNPPLLMSKLARQLREFKEDMDQSESLFEISMSPSSLKKLSAQTGALAGMEFEMIVPNTDGGDDSGDLEPDYEYDERCRSIEDAVQFFHDGDYNGRRDVERLRDRMLNDFHEWLGDKLYREWERNGEEYLEEWVPNNVDESEWNPDGLEGDERQEALEEFIANLHSDPGGSNAFDEYRDENLESYDESDWLDDEDLDRMSSIENTYSMSWPHWTSTGSGEASIEEVADSFQTAVGRDVKASSSYHSGRVERPSTKSLHYIVEPDGSLDPDDNNDQGLEFVSPPLPIEELLSDLNKVKAWADRTGCYTNDSTGLHINVSVPGWDGDMNKLDYVKLAVLLGDEFVLDSFGRAGNTYAKSAMGKIRSIVKQNPAKAEELLQRMKLGMDQLASKAIHSGVTEKYTSINTKNGYIEFRSPGGDWLNDNFAEIENTLRRFTVALSAAVDPEQYRQEYLKKLYKLLDVSGEKDPLSYFAKYSAGELPKAALKSFVRQAQLERGVQRGKEQPQQEPQGVDTRVNYELYSRASGAVIDTFPARNDDEAITRLSDYINFGAGQSNPDNFDVRRAGRAPIAGSTIDLQRQRAAAAAQQQPAPQPAGGEFTGNWLIRAEDGTVLHRFGGIGNSQADANRTAQAWAQRNPDVMRRYDSGLDVVPEMNESLREYRMPQPSQGPGRYRELNEPLGPETPPRMPAGTVKVDVSDTQDWYQLGQDISNLDIANKAHYNQGPPHTVLAFGSEDLEHMYIQQLKRLGLNTHDLDEPGEDDLDEGVRSALATAALAGTMAMGAQAKAPEMVHQTVEPGDTVYSIARQNNVNPLEIYRLNKMDRNTKLEVGQRVVVPDYSKPVSKMPATVAPTVKQPPAAQPAPSLKDKISSFMPKMPTDTEGVVLLSDNPDAEAALQTAAKAAGLKGSELAQFMAQTRHESWDFGKMKEVGNKKTFAKYEKPRLAKQLGNKVKGDGERFKGRGFIQLTGRDNYTRASQQIFGDDRLVKNPDLATRLDVGAQIALWFWKNQVRPAVKDFNNTTQVVKAINADEPAKVVQARHNKFKEYMAVL